MSEFSVQERLDKVKSIALKCGNCELCKTRHNLVFGEGNPEAKVMFVGEAPGRDEDLSGRPFIGRSGQFLRKMIRAIDLDPEKDCYIANVVKDRPPNNRPPKDNEIEECSKFLKKQIDIIRPSIIVLLGKTSIKGLFPEMSGERVGVLRDRSKRLGDIRYGDSEVVVSYHPSAVMQRAQYRPGAKEDFLYLQSLYEEVVKEFQDIF